MKAMLANYSASISELKRNPSALLKEADGSPIAILNHNTPSAYLVPAKTYEVIMESLEDLELGQLILERESEKSQAIKVSLNEL